MADDELEALAASVVILSSCKLMLQTKRKRRRRRCWMWSLHPSKIRCTDQQDAATIKRELINDAYLECRMSTTDFEFLIQSLAPKISRRDTTMRKAVSATERLAVCLRYLATGDIFSSLALSFGISEQIVSAIVPEVCEKIVELLGDSVKLPETTAEWKRIEEGFIQRWNFPHCVGVLDAKRIMHRSKACRIISLAMVDADGYFAFVETETIGSNSDPFACMGFFRKMQRGELNLPQEEPLPGHLANMPYVFIGDDNFPINTHVLKRYTGEFKAYTTEQLYNYQLELLRNDFNNVYDHMTNVFRCLKKPMLILPDNVMLVYRTCLILHNFLKRSDTSSELYSSATENNIECNPNKKLIPIETLNCPYATSTSTSNQITNEPCSEITYIQNEFAQYFSETSCIE